MEKQIKINTNGEHVIYFTFEVEFPFNTAIDYRYSDTCYGSWNKVTGEIGLCVGDYRRAEMVLWKEAPKGFEDGNYSDDKTCNRDKITAQDMADLLGYKVYEILALAVVKS